MTHEYFAIAFRRSLAIIRTTDKSTIMLESKTNSKTRSIHLEKSPSYIYLQYLLAGVEKPIIFDEKETV